MTTFHVETETELPRVQVVIPAGHGQILVRTYVYVLRQLVDMLEEIDRVALPDRTARFDWRMAEVSMNGNTRMVIAPKTVPGKRSRETLHLPSQGLIDGINALTGSARIPALFTDQIVERVEQLGAKLAKENLGAAEITALGQPDRAAESKANSAVVDEGTVQHARSAVAPVARALSSVTGRLDRLSATKKGVPRAALRDDRTGAAIAVIAFENHTEALREAWRHRVTIRGLLTRNAEGQPIRIEAEEVLPALASVLPRMSARELLGIAPDWTGDLSTADYLAEMRRG